MREPIKIAASLLIGTLACSSEDECPKAPYAGCTNPQPLVDVEHSKGRPFVDGEVFNIDGIGIVGAHGEPDSKVTCTIRSTGSGGQYIWPDCAPAGSFETGGLEVRMWVDTTLSVGPARSTSDFTLVFSDVDGTTIAQGRFSPHSKCGCTWDPMSMTIP